MSLDTRNSGHVDGCGVPCACAAADGAVDVQSKHKSWFSHFSILSPAPYRMGVLSLTSRSERVFTGAGAAAVGMHAARIFFTGAFRKPREMNWVIGTVLLLLACVCVCVGVLLLLVCVGVLLLLVCGCVVVVGVYVRVCVGVLLVLACVCVRVRVLCF